MFSMVQNKRAHHIKFQSTFKVDGPVLVSDRHFTLEITETKKGKKKLQYL